MNIDLQTSWKISNQKAFECIFLIKTINFLEVISVFNWVGSTEFPAGNSPLISPSAKACIDAVHLL